MPIYEYQCPKCGQFEVTQRITDSPLKKCPTCRTKVTKIMSATSFQLKGSGWYATDYARSGGEGKTSKASEGAGADSCASDSKGGEAKSPCASCPNAKENAAA